MQRLILAVVSCLLLSMAVGCVVPIYSADPDRRVQQLIYTSEGLRLLLDEWERAWLLDHPDHMTPYRTHGGII